MAKEGLEYMSSHFLPHHKPWLKGGRAWAMHWGSQEMRSWTDYIMGTESHLFRNVVVQDAKHNTDHYLLLGCLCGSTPAAHSRYLERHTRFPIRTPETSDRVDHIFSELRRDIPRSPW